MKFSIKQQINFIAPKYFYIDIHTVKNFKNYRGFSLKDKEKINKLSNLLKNLNLNKKVSILEPGCGMGHFALPFLLSLQNNKFCFEYIGVDISIYMLERFIKNLKYLFYPENKIGIFWSDMENFQMENKMFDIIIFSLVIHYFNEPLKVLENCTNYLKNGGVFLFFFRVDKYLKAMAEKNKFEDEDPLIKFWEKYNSIRPEKSFFPIENRKLIYDYSPILNFLKAKEINLIKEQELKKKSRRNINYYLYAIENGVWSSVSWNLDEKERRELKEKMEEFIKEEGLPLEIEEEKNFKILVFQK